MISFLRAMLREESERTREILRTLFPFFLKHNRFTCLSWFLNETASSSSRPAKILGLFYLNDVHLQNFWWTLLKTSKRYRRVSCAQ